jgi:ABC-2 type transport system permease protein
MLKALIRVTAFWGKEFAEVLRQPRLVLSLVLGPFLILLLFGIGYRAEPRKLRTMLVVPPNSNLQALAEQYAGSLGEQLILVGATADEKEALDRLARHEVDVVVVVPSDAYQTIVGGQQAVLQVYHDEIDPTQVGYVNYFSQIYIQEVNRRILMSLAEIGQAQAAQAQSELERARGSLDRLTTALRTGDRAQARIEAEQLDASINRTQADLSTNDQLLRGVEDTVGQSSSAASHTELTDTLHQLDDRTNRLQQVLESPNTDVRALSEELSTLDHQLAHADELLAEVQIVPPNVLVSPFITAAHSVAPYQPDFVAFYAPGVLALLLQHMAVTFAALSLVRERLLGAIEVFRVAPISPFETLLGKYISYLVFGLVIAAVLTGLMVGLLKVPILGPLTAFGAVIGLLLFASLGMGFFISAVSGSDSQAVQLSMIVLLASMFFSGFILPLSALWLPVRSVSFLLPVTYTIILLQDVMLRGTSPVWLYAAALAAGGIVLAVASWWVFKRQFVRA